MTKKKPTQLVIESASLLNYALLYHQKTALFFGFLDLDAENVEGFFIDTIKCF